MQPLPTALAGQREQHLDAGVIGEVQVVHGHGLNRSTGEYLPNGVVQHQPLAGRGQRQRWRELGQHPRQLASLFGVDGVDRPRQSLAQQPCQGGIGYAGITGPTLHHGQPPLARHLGDQARLAHASLAQQQHHSPGLPALSQRCALALAPDQPRWPHQGGSVAAQCSAGQRRRWQCGVAQRLGQRLGVGMRACVVGMGQLAHQALVHGQACSAVAAQIVQAHQFAVRGFGVGVGGKQGLASGKGGVEITFGLGPGDAFAQLCGLPGVVVTAFGAQPRKELRAVGKVELSQQRRAVCASLDLHAVRQCQHVAIGQQGQAQAPAKPQQLLAQVASRIVRLGPQPQRGALACAAGLQRGQRTQGGRAPLQRHGLTAR